MLSKPCAFIGTKRGDAGAEDTAEAYCSAARVTSRVRPAHRIAERAIYRGRQAACEASSGPGNRLELGGLLLAAATLELSRLWIDNDVAAGVKLDADRTPGRIGGFDIEYLLVAEFFLPSRAIRSQVLIPELQLVSNRLQSIGAVLRKLRARIFSLFKPVTGIVRTADLEIESNACAVFAVIEEFEMVSGRNPGIWSASCADITAGSNALEFQWAAELQTQKLRQNLRGGQATDSCLQICGRCRPRRVKRILDIFPSLVSTRITCLGSLRQIEQVQGVQKSRLFPAQLKKVLRSVVIRSQFHALASRLSRRGVAVQVMSDLMGKYKIAGGICLNQFGVVNGPVFVCLIHLVIVDRAAKRHPSAKLPDDWVVRNIKEDFQVNVESAEDLLKCRRILFASGGCLWINAGFVIACASLWQDHRSVTQSFSHESKKKKAEGLHHDPNTTRSTLFRG